MRPTKTLPTAARDATSSSPTRAVTGSSTGPANSTATSFPSRLRRGDGEQDAPAAASGISVCTCQRATAPTRRWELTPSRNGEPYGELGLVKQKDASWEDATGSPRDPQPGNTSGVNRDVLRSADFTNITTAQAGFLTDNGHVECQQRHPPGSLGFGKQRCHKHCER